MRNQDDNYVVFDDLLALSPCHLNGIPTSTYIPDFRYLLASEAGKAIALDLRARCVKVFQEQFWGNDAWRKKNIRGSADMSFDDMAHHLITGFNYPPSQYQLHLQFFAPPLMPFHYQAYLNDVHFTKGRFIPFEYFSAITNLSVTFETKEDTQLEEIFAFYKKHGVDYDEVWQKCFDRYGESHRLLANWDPADFDSVVVGKDVFQINHSTGALAPDSTTLANDLVNKDKLALQNYGRPYASGKPTGTYYKFSKVPSAITAFL